MLFWRPWDAVDVGVSHGAPQDEATAPDSQRRAGKQWGREGSGSTGDLPTSQWHLPDTSHGFLVQMKSPSSSLPTGTT